MIAKDSRRRAERLSLWYPAVWRARYGEEFIALLESDIEDRPSSPTRTFDIIRAGLGARLDAVAIRQGGLAPAASQVRLLLAVVLASFAVLALAVWSELAVSWRWEEPTSGLTMAAMFLMTAGLAIVIVLGLMSMWRPMRDAIQLPTRSSTLAVCLVTLSGSLLLFGGIRFSAQWPGTGGHQWFLHDLVPTWLGSFAWGLTRWITAYWAHPSELSHFSRAEIMWMIISPVLTVAWIAGVALLARASTGLRFQGLRSQRWIRQGYLAGATLFILGFCAWLISREASDALLFHAGKLDLLLSIAMFLALAVVSRVTSSSGQNELHFIGD